MRSPATRSDCAPCRCDRATTCAARFDSPRTRPKTSAGSSNRPGHEVCLFSSDYPHVEGGRRPIERFEASLANTSPEARQAFYHDNFVDVMGAGLRRAAEVAASRPRSDHRADIGHRRRGARLDRRCCTTRTYPATGTHSRCNRRVDRAAVPRRRSARRSVATTCWTARSSRRVSACDCDGSDASASPTSPRDSPIRWATWMKATRRNASGR